MVAGRGAWRAGLRRCLETELLGLVGGGGHDSGEVQYVLLRVAPGRVSHPIHALVADDAAREPLILVLGLHPTVTKLLEALGRRITDPIERREIIEGIVTSIALRHRHSTTGAAAASASVAAHHEMLVTGLGEAVTPWTVNTSGGGLLACGEGEDEARVLLNALTMALEGDGDADDVWVEHAPPSSLLVLVEHGRGFIGRRYVQSPAEDAMDDETTPTPAIFHIERLPWAMDSAAEITLDDLLESYDRAYREEMEFLSLGSPTTSSETTQPTLSVQVRAGFHVRDRHRQCSSSAFTLDTANEIDPTTSSATPPICLLSTWSGLENVRSLVCKPPPQAKSVLCFTDATITTPSSRNATVSGTLQVLEQLSLAIQFGDNSISWGNHHPLAHHLDDTDRLQRFRRFLANIDQEFTPGTHEGLTNNTMDSTLSMIGDQDDGTSDLFRGDMDFLEKVWTHLVKNATSVRTVVQSLQELALFLASTRTFPSPHPENNTELAQLVRVRQQECQSELTASASAAFTTQVQQKLAEDMNAIRVAINLGEWKMKRDVVHWLGQTGFSIQECNEFVQALPAFTREEASSSHAHWRAMEHVLCLCINARAIGLPVSFMRKLVHDCIEYYAMTYQTSNPETTPLCVELSTFIPDQLRSSIAEPLFWDMKMAFDHNLRHSIRICQRLYSRPTPTTSKIPLKLDDLTIQGLHRALPEHVLLFDEMIAFIAEAEKTRWDPSLVVSDDFESCAVTRFHCIARKITVYN